VTELEKELGFELFSRRPVALTAAGRHYLERISPLIEEYDGIVASCAAIEKQSRKNLAIWQPALEGRALQVYYEAIERMRVNYPEFIAEFKCDRQYSAFNAVEDNMAQIGIVYKGIQNLPNSVECELLFEEPFNIILHKDNPLANKTPLHLEEIAKSNYLICSTNRRFEDWNSGVIGVFRRYGIEPKCRMKDIDGLTSYFAALNTDEMSMTSPILGSLSALNLSLVSREVDDIPVRTYPTYLIYRKDPDDTYTQVFVQHCLDIAQELKQKNARQAATL
jgi:DNA-binding transcriptional LysR family regulator